MSWNGKDRRNGEPGRRYTDRGVCALHDSTCREIGQVRKEHRWTYGIMITVLLAAMALLAGVLKDFKTELASIGKAQAGIEARQEIILKRIKPLQLNRFDPKADLPILDIYGASDAFTLPGDAYPEDGARDYYNTTMPGKGADLRLIWPPEKY